MSFEAHIIADSISPAGIRLTTFQLRYPRFIHAELMTHRVFSRNASSSRAIPVEKMIRDLRRDPAMPIFWGSNKPGMQAGAELEGDDLYEVKAEWSNAMQDAIKTAEYLIERGLHKQIANRILEPWGHINVVVTSTEWSNFYTLRRDPTAQPEIKHLADLMWDAHESGPMPQKLEPGQWHLPYITREEFCGDEYPAPWSDETRAAYWDKLIKTSVARCARVSYLTHDGRKTSIEEDLQLYDRLLGAQPLHASPAEHQATPDEAIQHGFKETWMRPELHGNLRGWIQYRKTLPGEFVAG